MTDAPLAGNLEDTPFAEIAGALFQQKKTGILTVTSPQKERKVVFYQGHPVAVLSGNPREHIARFLAAKGKITKAQAEELLAVPETKEALQASPVLTKELLAWGVKFRFINLSYDLFRWTEGSYSFEEGAPPRDQFLMKVPAPSLILKGTKHMPPSLLLEKVPGSYQIGPGATTHEELPPLGEEEAAFLRDCREGTMVRDVFEESSVEVARARELLFAFQCLGLVSLDAVPEEPAELAAEVGGMEMEGFVLDEVGDEAPEAEAAIGAEGIDATEAAVEPDVPGDEEAPFAFGTPEPLSDSGPATGESPEAPSLETGGGDDARGPEAGEEEAPALELELEPAGTAPAGEPPAEEGPAFEIERHSYDEPAAGDAPPFLDDEGPQPLDGPPPLEFDAGASPEPPPLEAPGGDSELPPLDGGVPAAGDDVGDLPPPPWQEAAADDTGDGGMSPFAPPAGEEEPQPSRREKREGGKKKETKERRPSGPLAKVVTLVALLAAMGVVGAGAWLGWQNLRSPSEPLKPIPEADSVSKDTMAEGLPVPALPTSVKKAVKSPAAKTASPTPAPARPAAPAPKASVSPAGSSDFYTAGYAAFAAGDIDGAAAAWFEGLKSVSATHTITIIGVACQGDTVRNEMKRFGRERKVFAVPRTYKDKACYRILMGVYSSESAAAAAIDGLPPSLGENLSISSIKGII